MDKGLRVQLQILTDVDFIELSKAINTAQKARNLIFEYNISDNEFCLRMSINKSKFKEFINGSYPYTLMDLAKMEVYGKELYIKRANEEA